MDPRDLYRQALLDREYRALGAWLSTFYPFQQDWLLERQQRAICNKSRQIGLSHTTSGVGVLWGVFHGELTTIISVGQNESNEVLDKARKHAELLRRLGSDMARTRSSNATEIVFESGGRIISLPSSGGRGFTGNVFLDEYAYQEHAAEVWDAAAAVTLLGFRLRVASTPNGIGNEFELLWRKTASDEGWARHEIPIQKATEQGYPVDLKSCWALAKNDPRLFDQLFNGKFLDGQLQYIPTEAIEACSVDDLYTYDGEYCAGLDIGRTIDRTELIVVRKDPQGVRWVQHIASCKRTESDEIERMVAEAFRQYSPKRLCVDSTGIGAFPAERLQKKHGRLRVEPVSFTLQVKEELATCLYSAFTEETVRIPKTDEALKELPAGAAVRLRNDLCAIRREVTKAGNVRYDAPHTDEGHADSAWALALALHACSGPGNAKSVIHDHVPEPDTEVW